MENEERAVEPFLASKLERIIEDVYVVSRVGDKLILQNRNYGILAEVPIHPKGGSSSLLLDGVCVCQHMQEWGANENAFWFCLSEKTNRRATAEIWDVARTGKKQVVMRQEGCGEG